MQSKPDPGKNGTGKFDLANTTGFPVHPHTDDDDDDGDDSKTGTSGKKEPPKQLIYLYAVAIPFFFGESSRCKLNQVLFISFVAALIMLIIFKSWLVRPCVCRIEEDSHCVDTSDAMSHSCCV